MRQFLIIFLVSVNSTFGQNVVLGVFNPAPRLGQEIIVTVRVTDFYNPQDSIDLDLEKDLGDGQIKLNTWALDTGLLKIGPMNLKINERIYKSDSVQLHIDPPLPAETLGLWIRQLTFREKEYLIIEQRIPGEWKRMKGYKRNHAGSSFSSEEFEFSELNTDELDQTQLDLFLRYSTSKIEAAGQRFRGGNANTTYKVFVYEIIKGPDFQKEYVIVRGQFNKLPKEVKFDRWSIK